MVAFRVKVKLVENMVKSHEGSVKVVKVMIQYSSKGIAFRIKRTKRASRPNQVAGSEGTTSLAAAEPSFDRADAATSAMVVVVVDVDRASVRVAVAVKMLVDMIDSAAAATDAFDSRDDIVMDELELSQGVVLKGCNGGRGIRSDNSGSSSWLSVTSLVTV